MLLRAAAIGFACLLSLFSPCLALGQGYTPSLLIMDPKIVHPGPTDCDLAPAYADWRLDSLMNNISADGHSGANLIQQWLALYGASQKLANGATALAAPAVARQILGPWDRKQLPPFRLLAIVNRIDLRGSPLLSGENGGEIRFVFGAVDLTHNCKPLPFAVILEYGVRRSDCDALEQWARDWATLTTGNLSPQAYLHRLESLTDEVTRRNAVPAKPNGSALDRIRSNENLESLHGSQWEMREFSLSAGVFKEDPVTLTPDNGLNGTGPLAMFLTSINPAIVAQDYWVPLGMLGAVASPGASTSNPFWSAPGITGDVIRGFSRNTCSGCHTLDTVPGSTATANNDFTHIDPTALSGSGASAFLLDQVAGARCFALCRLATATTATAEKQCRLATAPPNAREACAQWCKIPAGQRGVHALVD